MRTNTISKLLLNASITNDCDWCAGIQPKQHHNFHSHPVEAERVGDARLETQLETRQLPRTRLIRKSRRMKYSKQDASLSRYTVMLCTCTPSKYPMTVYMYVCGFTLSFINVTARLKLHVVSLYIVNRKFNRFHKKHGNINLMQRAAKGP